MASETIEHEIRTVKASRPFCRRTLGKRVEFKRMTVDETVCYLYLSELATVSAAWTYLPSWPGSLDETPVTAVARSVSMTFTTVSPVVATMLQSSLLTPPTMSS